MENLWEGEGCWVVVNEVHEETNGTRPTLVQTEKQNQIIWNTVPEEDETGFFHLFYAICKWQAADKEKGSQLVEKDGISYLSVSYLITFVTRPNYLLISLR